MMTHDSKEDWDDLLGTGAVLKKIIEPGRRPQLEDEEVNLEAPRKFFALIDIETFHDNKPIPSESHKNYLINCDADLFAGAHLVIPLMELGERARYVFDPRFAYGDLGVESAEIPANAKLECIIELKLRSQYDEFLSRLLPHEKLSLASRKRERGKFWFAREDYHNAISIYQTIADLCSEPQISEQVQDPEGDLS